MFKTRKKITGEAGFSLVEMLIVMTVLLVVLSLVSSVFMAALGTRDRETQKTDALTSVQAALNVMSREIGTSGFGLDGNGIVTANSNENKIHFRANIQNDDWRTDDAGEEIMYYYDAKTNSVVRYDRFATPSTSIVINRVSNVTFKYFNFSGSNSSPVESSVATNKTGKIKISLLVQLDDVQGQPKNQKISLTTEIALRNSEYMLNQY